VLDPVTLIGGMVVNAHPMVACLGRHCSIHDPSPHHMREWDQVWMDANKTMYRRCPHGTLHPDPDHLAYIKSLFGDDWEMVYQHGSCCGCCSPSIDGEVIDVRAELSSSASASSSLSPAALPAGRSSLGLDPCSGSSCPPAPLSDNDPYQA